VTLLSIKLTLRRCGGE